MEKLTMPIKRVIEDKEVDIELYEHEILLASIKKDLAFLKDDIEIKTGIEFDIKDVESIKEIFDDRISNHDSYWEIYWYQLEQSVFEYLESKDGDSNA